MQHPAALAALMAPDSTEASGIEHRAATVQGLASESSPKSCTEAPLKGDSDLGGEGESLPITLAFRNEAHGSLEIHKQSLMALFKWIAI